MFVYILHAQPTILALPKGLSYLNYVYFSSTMFRESMDCWLLL